jgi:hypothetical protein
VALRKIKCFLRDESCRVFKREPGATMLPDNHIEGTPEHIV